MPGIKPTDLNALAYAGIDPANDVLVIGDASDATNFAKKTALLEFIQRSLDGATIAWMSSLAIGSVDPTNDRFLVWDASASGWRVITGAGLLDATLYGQSIAGLSSLALTAVDGGADRFLIWDNSATAWRVITASEITTRLLSSATTPVVSTPRAVLAAEAGQRFSNTGAAQVITFTLPTAVVGYRYSFLRTANYAVHVDPNGSETIGDGGAGKYLEIASRGQVDIECLATGVWEVTSGAGLFAYEA
jgi:hypothetical protein